MVGVLAMQLPNDQINDEMRAVVDGYSLTQGARSRRGGRLSAQAAKATPQLEATVEEVPRASQGAAEGYGS